MVIKPRLCAPQRHVKSIHGNKCVWPRPRGTKVCYHMQLRGTHFDSTLTKFHLHVR